MPNNPPQTSSNASKYSEERAIEKLWKSAYQAIYGEEYKKNHPDESKRAAELQCINVAYGIAKEIFQGIERASGERYFEHLREVTNIIISGELGNSVTPLQVTVAILHDIIEDSSINAFTLEEIFSKRIEGERGKDFGKRVSKAVVELSKNNWREYITSKSDLDFVNSYESGQIAVGDEDGFITDLFGSNSKTRKEHSRHKRIKKAAKENRNHDFFSQLGKLDDEILTVKFADRIHNLRTQWNPDDIQQVKRKIKETKLYFFPIAKERNIKAYKILCKEIKKLEQKLGGPVNLGKVIDFTKHWSQQALAA